MTSPSKIEKVGRSTDPSRVIVPVPSVIVMIVRPLPFLRDRTTSTHLLPIIIPFVVTTNTAAIITNHGRDLVPGRARAPTLFLMEI